MKPYDIELNAFSVSVFPVPEEAPEAANVTDNGLIVLTQPKQTLAIDAADEVPLFIGVKGQMLTGKAYSLNESLRERPYIDLSSLLLRLHLDPNQVEAFLGPSLTFAHIEQADEVLTRVKELGYDLACKGTSGVHYLDQQVLVLLQLRKIGIPMNQIHVSCYDTYDTKGLKSALGGDEKKNRFIATFK